MRRGKLAALVAAAIAIALVTQAPMILDALSRPRFYFTDTPTSPVAGQPVTFTASNIGGPKPYTYLWGFGDGSTGSGATAIHTYRSAGTYAVNVTASDARGRTSSSSQLVVVLAPPPFATDFTFSPTDPLAGSLVNFTAKETNGTSPCGYGWQFGDGTTGTGALPAHAYGAVGTYVVNLTATDSAGHTANASHPVSVTNPPALVASFTYSPSSPIAGQTVNFSAAVSGGKPPYREGWQFGDGATGAGATTAHTYSSAGTYVVTLTATDATSTSAKASKTIVVATAPPPTLAAGVSFSPSSPVVGQAVTFKGSATGGTPPYQYAWAFGDGGVAAGANATHAYATAATYTVTLTVTDASAHKATASKSVTVAPVSSGGTYFDTIVVIVMENKGICQILTTCGGAGVYETQLAQAYGLATRYVDCSSPSLPNYLCLTGASDFGCSGYDGGPNSNGCTSTAWNAPNIVDRLEAGGLTWKAYMENMPSNCYGSDSGSYAVRHDPFVYYSDIVTNANRCARVVPAGSYDATFLGDLGSTSTASNYMWLTPNTCNDMHDCSVATGDAYLQGLVPRILNSTVFQTRRAALFITFDEDSGGSGAPDLYTIWAGPVAKKAFASSVAYGHFSLLSTIEANWNLLPLTSNDKNAAAMGEFFATPATANMSPAARGSTGLIASPSQRESKEATASCPAGLTG